MEWGTGFLLSVGEVKAAGEKSLPIYLYSLVVAHRILGVVANLGSAVPNRPNRTPGI